MNNQQSHIDKSYKSNMFNSLPSGVSCFIYKAITYT